jgi:hypothetical protein
MAMAVALSDATAGMPGFLLGCCWDAANTASGSNSTVKQPASHPPSVLTFLTFQNCLIILMERVPSNFNQTVQRPDTTSTCGIHPALLLLLLLSSQAIPFGVKQPSSDDPNHAALALRAKAAADALSGLIARKSFRRNVPPWYSELFARWVLLYLQASSCAHHNSATPCHP